MSQVEIFIRTKNDVNPPIVFAGSPRVDTAELRTVVILEGGMQSGKTSMALHFKLANGQHAIAEVAGTIFQGIAQALKGAQERFEGELIETISFEEGIRKIFEDNKIPCTMPLIHQLKTDPDYHESWKANIAMAFQDTFNNYMGTFGRNEAVDAIHQVSNTAAEHFLNILLLNS